MSASSNGANSAHPGGQRYKYVDALRGFAALGVVLLHADDGGHFSAFFQWLPSFARWIIRHGNDGVEVFFVLSGFVIAHAVGKSRVTFGYAGRFMLRRSIRLDPPYWASMILYIALQALSTLFVSGKHYVPPPLRQIGLHMLYAQHFFGEKDIIPVYWTLCFEIQFYLSFCLLMILAARLTPRIGQARALLLVLVPPVLFASLWPLGLAPWSSYRVIAAEKWHLFLAGALVSYSLDGRSGRTGRLLAWLDVVFLTVVAGLRQDAAMMVGALTAASILIVGERGKLTTWLRARPLQWLGGVSYSLYLVHIPVTGALFRVAYRLTGRTLRTEGLWFFGNIAVCLVAAELFHRFIEQPSMLLSRRVPMSPRPPARKVEVQAA
jgi:peptidoglycan/LPS O-acetylase OafA/YrhL